MPERELSEDELLAVEDAATERDATPDELAEIEQAASAPPEPQEAPPAPRRPIPAAPEPLPLVGGVALNPDYWKSQATAVGRNLTAGFLKQGSDEFEGAVSRLKDVMPGACYTMPLSPERPVANNDDLYRAARDNVRERLEISKEQHPLTSFLANAAGDLGSDAVLQYLGVPVASSAYQAAAGAVSGLMGSDAELSSGKATPRSGASAAASTALGAGLGYLAPKAGAWVTRDVLPAILPRLREGLENFAITQGRRVLLNGADALAGNKELRASSVREALESGAISPLGTTQSAYAALEALAEQRGGAYATILERLQALGVQGPEVEAIARQLTDKADDSWRNSGADKSVASLFRSEADNVRAVAPAGFVMPESGAQGAPASNLVLDQAERMKRDLQGKARWERLRQTGLDEAKQEASQVFRGAIEDTIQQAGEAAPVGSEVAQLAEEFLPVKQQLARTIDARDAAERGTAAAAKRRGFSLTDNVLAAGAMASGGPAQALLAGAGNNLLRNRGTSTFAAGAYDASKAAGSAAKWLATEPDTARTLAQVGGGLMSRQATSSDWLQKLLGSNPEALGEYGPVLAQSLERGPEALAVNDYVLSQKDPAYRQKKEEAQKAAQGQR